MATPGVFVSSTFYDLRYIRENLRHFITGLGYQPVLSEEGAVYYDPRQDAPSAAIAEVQNSQLFVLIIGGRYGAEYQDSGRSVTNAEYREAALRNVPIFALVEQGTYNDYQVWRANRRADQVDLASIRFPNTEDPRVFDFIEEVRGRAVNNALVPFTDFSDIEGYLRQQWTGMMHSFLTGAAEEHRVVDMLQMLEDMNRRIEMLSSQILQSVGTAPAKVIANMYRSMLSSQPIQDLIDIGLTPTPSAVLKHETFSECTEALGGTWRVESDDEPYGFTISTSGEVSKGRYLEDERLYTVLRDKLEATREASGVSVNDIAAQEQPDT